MSKGLLFWLLFLLAAIFGLWPAYGYGWGVFGGGLLIFLLIGLLGWGIFGAPVK